MKDGRRMKNFVGEQLKSHLSTDKIIGFITKPDLTTVDRQNKIMGGANNLGERQNYDNTDTQIQSHPMLRHGREPPLPPLPSFLPPQIIFFPSAVAKSDGFLHL